MGVLKVDYTFDADGNSRTWNIPVSSKYLFYVTGTIGGGILTLEASPDEGVNWFTVDKLNGAGRLIRYLVSGETVRLCLAGSTDPDITAGIRQ